MKFADELAVLFLRGMGKLPLPMVYAIGDTTGFLLSMIPNEMRRITEINLALCFPDATPAWRKSLMRNSLKETAITACELGSVWTRNPQEFIDRIVSVEGEPAVQQALAEGKGVVLLVPHLGNWEVAGYYLSQKYDFGAMYKPGRLPKLDQLILNARKQLKSVIVPADKTGVIALFKRLKQNKMIGILPDQEPDKSGGIFAPLFGIPALTQTLGPKLVKQANAEVFGLMCIRDRKNKGYRVYFKPLDPAIHDKNLDCACAAMNRSLEAWVKLFPEQYQWEYKRFSKRPSGLPKLYKQ